MAYKVFLVEDEIVTREGIRDSVDWGAAGYQFCGEAPDGELALPQIREQRPETVITDIKMPFMDGLQLCRILKETLPDTKIIILSGHDEFKYAQEAIHIGVAEYLLKPVSALDLINVLRKVAGQLDQERQVAEHLRAAQAQAASQRSILRERCLLNLVAGTTSSAEAIEQCRNMGLDLLAPWYQVMLVRADTTGAGSYQLFQQVDAIIAETIAATPSVIGFKKDLEETVLILKGDHPDRLEQVGRRLARRLRQQIETRTACRAAIGRGAPTERIGTIAQSFAQALLHTDADDQPAPDRRADLLKPDSSAMMLMLRSGVRADFDRFFASYLVPLGDVDQRSRVLIDYVFTDVVLSAANFLRELGGSPEELLPDLRHPEALLADVQDLDQAKELARQVFQVVLEYRDRQAHRQGALIAKARDYIDAHYADPDISLSSVAARVTLSPSYFSVVFSRAVGETFIEYLTNVRMRKAMELLRTTPLTSGEIAYHVGYHNPRYFYSVFRKVVGLPPTEFRRRE
jgi:two-component system, response regulator YesN